MEYGLLGGGVALAIVVALFASGDDLAFLFAQLADNIGLAAENAEIAEVE